MNGHMFSFYFAYSSKYTISPYCFLNCLKWIQMHACSSFHNVSLRYSTSLTFSSWKICKKKAFIWQQVFYQAPYFLLRPVSICVCFTYNWETLQFEETIVCSNKVNSFSFLLYWHGMPSYKILSSSIRNVRKKNCCHSCSL